MFIRVLLYELLVSIDEQNCVTLNVNKTCQLYNDTNIFF